MKILIAVASKHGSTSEIAEVIADELRTAGYTVDLHPAAEMVSMTGYDAAIIGSAVYMGRWLSEAQELIEDHQNQFAAMPVWLFSSGPLGNEPTNTREHDNPINLQELLALTQAEGHRVFDGRLEKERLGLGERLVVRMVHAPEGDFRDWTAIREWAHEIAEELPTFAAVSGSARQIFWTY